MLSSRLACGKTGCGRLQVGLTRLLTGALAVGDAQQARNGGQRGLVRQVFDGRRRRRLRSADEGLLVLEVLLLLLLVVEVVLVAVGDVLRVVLLDALGLVEVVLVLLAVVLVRLLTAVPPGAVDHSRQLHRSPWGDDGIRGGGEGNGMEVYRAAADSACPVDAVCRWATWAEAVRLGPGRAFKYVVALR